MRSLLDSMKKFLYPLILLLYTQNISSQDFFRSNNIGMTIEKIDPHTAAVYEYYVTVTTVQENEAVMVKKKSLYHNGELVTIWEKRNRNGMQISETVIRGDIREVSSFINGQLDSFSVFEKDELQEEWKYTYGNGAVLVAREKVFPEDASELTSYTIMEDGQLRSKKRVEKDLPTELVIQGISDNKYVQWIGRGDTGTFERYSQGRRLVTRRILGNDSEDWYYTYFDKYYVRRNYKEPASITPVSVDTQSSHRIEEVYNFSDRLISKTVFTGGTRQYYETAQYAEDEIRLLFRTVIENATRYDTEYSYDDTKMIQENQYINKKLAKTITYSSSGRIEHVYQDSILAYMLRYDADGLLISSETALEQDNP